MHTIKWRGKPFPTRRGVRDKYAGARNNGRLTPRGHEGPPLSLVHTLRFVHGYVRDPHVVGALAPSSRLLAAALAEPMRRSMKPACVLEIGAGTGPITGYLGEILRSDDRLDVCEMHPAFVRILERDVLSKRTFSRAVAEKRVRLLPYPVQQLDCTSYYDFVICSLPFTVFQLSDVEAIFEVIKRSLRPGGIMSYFEYAGMRRISRNCSVGPRRRRVREVSSFLTSQIGSYQVASRTVFKNLPPARVRYLQFEPAGGTEDFLSALPLIRA